MPSGRTLSIWFAHLSVLLLIFTAAHLSPLGSMLAAILAPLPVLLTGWRLNDKGALGLVLAGIAFMVALNPGLATLWHNLGFLSLLLMGLLLSVFQNRGLSPSGAIFVTVLVLNGLALLLLVGQAVYQGITLPALLAQRSAEIMQSVHQVMGEGKDTVPLIPGVSQGETEAFLQRLLPGLLITNTGLVAWLNIVLLRQLQTVATGQKPEPPLYNFALPEWFIFGALGAGFMMYMPVAPLRIISLNLLLVLGVLYFCQGVAVVSAWFNRLGLPRILRVIGYPLMFLSPLFFLIITLGVLDLWLDFRRLHQQPGDAGGGIES
ncbi:MAG: YybS family protein [Deltaproteobacteria bacterium]|nr:YybS family protein [Deltaproteobacteria bacterium]